MATALAQRPLQRLNDEAGRRRSAGFDAVDSGGGNPGFDGELDLGEPGQSASRLEGFLAHGWHVTTIVVTSQVPNPGIGIAQHGRVGEAIHMDSEPTTTFGETLRKARQQRRLTQNDLARLVDETCNNQQVSNWERGAHRPDYRRFLRLSEIFGWKRTGREFQRWFEAGEPSAVRQQPEAETCRAR